MRPIINIKYGRLLEPFFQNYVETKYPDTEIPSTDSVLEKVGVFKKVWKEKGDIFLDFLFKEMNCEFERNIIDCFIISSTPRDMSAPLVIRSRWTESEFFDVLIHELVHIFLSDNKIEKIEDIWGVSQTTINHIMVFAILKKFYLEVLRDEERLNQIMSKSSPTNNIDYHKAWIIVEEVGYNKIIDVIKN